jgi:DNA-directed RNA polymerase II subunit RPB1
MVVNNWLVNTGFTVGVADIIAKPEICNQVAATIKQHIKTVMKVIDKTQKGLLEAQPGKSMIESFEHEINTELNNARNNAGRIVLNALASDNRLKNMVNAGSKGSDMNISQIMACVG